MSEEKSDEKPNPLVRQRDLDLVVANNKSEHWKTRVAFAIVSLPGAAKAAPAVLGVFGVHLPW